MHLPRLLPAFVLSVLLAGGGCAPAPVRADSSTSTAEVRSALRALAEGGSDQADRVSYAAQRLERYRLVPGAGGRFVRPLPSDSDSTVGHVLSYVPGRDATQRADLVVLAGNLEGAAGAAVLTVAHRLAQQGRYQQVPGPTVLVALWAAPRTGAQGFEDLAALPSWAADRVTRIVYAAPDTMEAQAIRWVLQSFEQATFQVVGPPQDGRTGASTQLEMEQARRAEAVLRWADALTEAMLAEPYDLTTTSSSAVPPP
ncbi:MAG: hypothetical protein AAGG50_13720 [Bacteroidota bacterium]